MPDFHEKITDLLPPEGASTAQAAWNRSIAGAVIAEGIVIMALAAYIFGIPFIMAAQVAPASLVADTNTAVSKIEQKIDDQSQQLANQTEQIRRDKGEMKALILRAEVNQLYDAWCGAIRGGRPLEADGWERQFNAALIQYNSVSPQPYPMRRCG